MTISRREREKERERERERERGRKKYIYFKRDQIHNANLYTRHSHEITA